MGVTGASQHLILPSYPELYFDVMVVYDRSCKEFFYSLDTLYSTVDRNVKIQPFLEILKLDSNKLRQASIEQKEVYVSSLHVNVK